jgi:hypothetical protein
MRLKGSDVQQNCPGIVGGINVDCGLAEDAWTKDGRVR